MTRIAGYVIENFRIPPEAAKPVQKESELFEKSSAEFTAAQQEMYSLKASRHEDITAANKAAAEARLKGGAPPKVTPATIDAKIDKARKAFEAAEATLDVAGEQLVAAIEEH